jgi:hypothetical protein
LGQSSIGFDRPIKQEYLTSFGLMVKISQLILLANIGLIPRYGIPCNQFSSTQKIERNAAKRSTSPNLVKIGMAEVKKMEKRKCKKKVCLWRF